jgi:hypothetical protein
MPRLTSISQSLGVIAGSVIDSVSQTRISSATITLFELAQSGRENQIGRAIPTDMSGGFSFDSVVPGAYVERPVESASNLVNSERMLSLDKLIQ